jgi:glycosyltransferase involved in cell wall biosynthesis
VGASVTLLGRREDMPELLAACDVFVLASRQEGSPAAVLEAMATGRPVVVTPPAAAALSEEGLGLTVPLDDSDALAAAVIELLDDGSRAAAMGSAAREHVAAHHSVEVMVRGYEEVYTELLAPGR